MSLHDDQVALDRAMNALLENQTLGVRPVFAPYLETLTLPRNLVGRRYRSEGATWCIDRFDTETKEYVVRCEGSNAYYSYNDMQRLRRLPADREWL